MKTFVLHEEVSVWRKISGAALRRIFWAPLISAGEGFLMNSAVDYPKNLPNLFLFIFLFVPTY